MSARTSRPVLRLAGCVALLVAGVSACSGSSDPSSRRSGPTSTTRVTEDRRWAALDRDLAKLGPRVGLLVARVDDGTCTAVHRLAASAPRPTGSQFKLFVLDALADQISAGRLSWDQVLTVTDEVRSLGNGEGSLQLAEAGTKVTVEEAATKMISISDNTAADMLIALVGRKAVEAQAARRTGDTTANSPFLTTQEMFLLHYVKGLGDRYLATPQQDREAFVRSSVDTRTFADLGSAYSTDPRFIDRIEWFASPDDICRAFGGLQQRTKDRAMGPLSSVLSRETGTIGLDRTAWPTIWFKGGSEPGVLTLGWLATNAAGATYVVEAMVSDPEAPLAESSITDLVALARRAFALVE